jgi:hypothetical protein
MITVLSAEQPAVRMITALLFSDLRQRQQIICFPKSQIASGVLSLQKSGWGVMLTLTRIDC